MATTKKKKPVYIPIKTQFGYATVEHRGEEREIKHISTGDHPMSPYVYHIEEAFYGVEGVEYVKEPDVVIRDFVEDVRQSKKFKQAMAKYKEMQKKVRAFQKENERLRRKLNNGKRSYLRLWKKM